MCVNPAYSSSSKAPIFDHLRDFGVGYQLRYRQSMQSGQDGCAVFQVAARQFARNERMDQNKSLRQAFRKTWITVTEVVNPDGSVGKHHHTDRRRGMFDSLGCVPPSAARRLPASRAIRASNPSRTKAVFCWIPVNSLARSSSLSSIINVVLICIVCIYLRIPVKGMARILSYTRTQRFVFISKRGRAPLATQDTGMRNPSAVLNAASSRDASPMMSTSARDGST